MGSHTPGPWKIFFWSEAIGVSSDRPKPRDCESIATVPRGPETCPDATRVLAEANARLIAAAPDMLEALRDLLGAAVRRPALTTEEDGFRDAARAAIKKAEGA